MTDLNVHTDTAAMARRRITFTSEGVELVGDLRLPAAEAGAEAGGGGGAQPGWPAIVLTGPFTGVKEQVTGSYAELLSAAGFATLAFDHRGFGESGGRRQHEDSQGKLADLRAAVSALAAPAEADPGRIGWSESALAAATPSGRRRRILGSGQWLGLPAATTARPRWRRRWASGSTGLPSAVSWTATTRTCLDVRGREAADRSASTPGVSASPATAHWAVKSRDLLDTSAAAMQSKT
jgi:fermentation-respiration switch protein FrsA (DUF1100 family)